MDSVWRIPRDNTAHSPREPPMTPFHRNLVRIIVWPTLVAGLVYFAGLMTNPDGASRRSRTSRVKVDMRSLATAIETYYIDNNAYPVAVVNNSVRKRAPGEPPVPSFTRGPSPRALTTPVTYLTCYFEDPFAHRGQTFGYWVPPDDKNSTHGWILFSPGPDGKFNLDWTKYDPRVPQPSPEILAASFDPTNGALSRGDIIWVKQ